ncbi:polynucleotide kinase-phosphatase [Heyndrickxia sporothermodurans]|nr:polynucleotide kinase-phosphatase [Heyndrickxia sporothermodurans]
MQIKLPHSGIVLLIGPSNSGKTSLLNHWIETKQILPTEVVGSDYFRILVGDVNYFDWTNMPKDEADAIFNHYQQVSKEAFSLLDSAIESRSRLNKLTFIDATHLHSDDRKKYISIAKKHHIPCIGFILDVSQDILIERDEHRENPRGKRRIKQQYQVFKREKRFLKNEGFAATYYINDANAKIIRQPNPIEIDIQNGIDLIGDIHGCFDELILLLEKMGYQKNEKGLYTHPTGRKFVSVGDIMSRGPHSLETMIFFLNHVKQGFAYMIDSNHGWKIARWLDGRTVTLSHGDEKVADEFTRFEEENGSEMAVSLKAELKDLLLYAPSHYVFTKNGLPVLVCTHAGIKDEFIGKQSPVISDFCRYGDTDGFDDSGKPIRKDWFIHHQTSPLIIWGHDPKPQPLFVNNTLNIDQGAVFGGKLTAYRYPEKEIISISAKKDYSSSIHNPLLEWEKKRFAAPNIGKFLNGYSVLTKDLGEIKVSKEIVLPAIDTISHFTIPIEQLIYIPPTMSPTPTTSSLDNYLEHPKEAIDYYRKNGVYTMIAEKKHMGSRGILFLFKDKETAKNYGGFETLGTIYSRTGRRFFDKNLEERVVSTLHKDLHSYGYFQKYKTDFLLLDAEIMPWNLKAKELISNQYAHVSENAILDRMKLRNKLRDASLKNEEINNWLQEYEEKLNNALRFKQIFQKYCWNINGIEQIQIAPFHVLAHSNETFFDKPHTWHMEMNREFSKLSNLFVETEYKVIHNDKSEEEVIKWWESMTSECHEGIVIKPEYFISKHNEKLLQPAIKVRGQKYLSIIYGMDYLHPENLKRLKNRNSAKKQKLALKEFALGVEGISRFVNGESIERAHECVLATLAMESDPVDPRL